MKFINAFVLSALLIFPAYTNAQAKEAELANTKGEWTLDVDKSRVNFITIKKGNIAESHVFDDVMGHVSDGKARITIKPDSIDSRVPIRNERMREFLFETGTYPTIEISADVDDAISKLEIGDSVLRTIPASLSLHGVTKELNLEVRISKLNDDIMVVASTEPVLVRAANFNMVEGIIKLSSLVNNLAIAETVPVNFSLELRKN